MHAVAIADSPRSKRITDEWNELSEQDRQRLIVVLLNSIIDWHAWSSTDAARMNWLQRQFDKAGVPFRSDT